MYDKFSANSYTFKLRATFTARSESMQKLAKRSSMFRMTRSGPWRHDDDGGGLCDLKDFDHPPKK